MTDRMSRNVVLRGKTAKERQPEEHGLIEQQDDGWIDLGDEMGASLKSNLTHGVTEVTIESLPPRFKVQIHIQWDFCKDIWSIQSFRTLMEANRVRLKVVAALEEHGYWSDTNQARRAAEKEAANVGTKES